MKLSLGFSPCPNDTFIFDALVNNKIDSQGLELNIFLADVEELNQKAKHRELDITKLSFHAFAHLAQHYNLLNSGSALGNKCGPLLISKRQIKKEELPDSKIAIPGQLTTAHFLLNFYQKNLPNKEFILFSEIEDAVLSGEYDTGVIIHENRFTYRQKGLQLIQDLGEYWEEETGYPIPLGGIAISKEVDLETQKLVNDLIRESIEYAFQNKSTLPAFIKENAQEMDEIVMRQHIELYVNKYSLDLGKKGRNAIQFMLHQIRPDLEINIIQ